MNNINSVVISGNLTRKPELRATKNSMVANLSVANNVYRKGAGEKNQKVNFIECVVWGKQAEFCVKYLDKGSHVAVSGTLDWQEWTDKDGKKRSTIKINAEQVEWKSDKKSTTAPAETEPMPFDEPSGISTDESPF